VFPCSEFDRLLKERHPHVEAEGTVFLTGVLEYICADLLQAAGNRSLVGEKSDSIGLSEIVQSMNEDGELSKLFFIVSSVCDLFPPSIADQA